MTAVELVLLVRAHGRALRPWVDHVRLVMPADRPCHGLLREVLDVLEEEEERAGLAEETPWHTPSPGEFPAGEIGK